MSIETTSRIAEGALGGYVSMLAFGITETLCGEAPFTEAYADELDCGTMRVRVRIEVEPTGLSPEEYAAAVVAGDPGEPEEVRAAARIVAAGGPRLEAARVVLQESGYWPF